MAGVEKYRSRVIENLKAGTFTDCVFLVGADGDELKRVHAIKSVMMMASPYMRNLFGGKWPRVAKGAGKPETSIRISNFSAKTFELLVEYAHVFEIRDVYLNGEELADLLVAADFYLMEELQMDCAALLKENIDVEYVWPVLDKLIMLPSFDDIVLACTEILRKKTDECLAHPSFLKAEEASVICLLNRTSMCLKREHQLIKFCIKWAKKQPDWILAMRRLMPYLRLLTLSPNEVADLPDFFKGAELAMLLKYSINKIVPEGKFPPHICTLTKSRRFTPNTAAQCMDPNAAYLSPALHRRSDQQFCWSPTGCRPISPITPLTLPTHELF